MKLALCSCCTIFWNLTENLKSTELARTIEQVWHEILLASDLPRVSLYDVLMGKVKRHLWNVISSTLALIMMTRVDWNRVGLAAGSNTDALDWNDWNNPLISRLNAKLLRNRT